MDELAIPSVTQTYLKESFNSVSHFTTDTQEADDYSIQMAPMERIEKKLLLKKKIQEKLNKNFFYFGVFLDFSS